MFQLTDFQIVNSKKVVYNGNYRFERNNSLTKFDIAVVLSYLEKGLCWCIMYDAFTKEELVSRLSSHLS